MSEIERLKAEVKRLQEMIDRKDRQLIRLFKEAEKNGQKRGN